MARNLPRATMTPSSTGHISENQLGTGQIDPHLEQILSGRGVVFATHFTAPDGETFVVSCTHDNIYDRFTEQVAKLYHEERGLPARYRIAQLEPV